MMLYKTMRTCTPIGKIYMASFKPNIYPCKKPIYSNRAVITLILQSSQLHANMNQPHEE